MPPLFFIVIVFVFIIAEAFTFPFSIIEIVFFVNVPVFVNISVFQHIAVNVFPTPKLAYVNDFLEAEKSSGRIEALGEKYIYGAINQAGGAELPAAA